MKEQATDLVMDFHRILGGDNATIDQKINIMEVAKRCARKAIVFAKKHSSSTSETITLRKIGEEIDKLDF